MEMDPTLSGIQDAHSWSWCIPLLCGFGKSRSKKIPNLLLLFTMLSYHRLNRFARLGLALGSALWLGTAFAQPKITPAKAVIGFSIGDDYQMASYTQISTLLKKWDEESDRLKVVSIGNTEEGRPQYMAIISSPANMQKLDHWKDISQKMARARMTPEEARALAKEGKAVVWIDGGLHATET